MVLILANIVEDERWCIVIKCLDRFIKKMEINGGSLRNERINNSKELLSETFFDDASLRLGMYYWELGKTVHDDYIDSEDIKVRIYKRTFSSANGVTMKFQSLLDTPIIVGDILYDSNEDEFLICTESHNIDDIHFQGRLTLCNWILKWQNKNGDILEYPCHDMNATQYNSGEQSNRQFVIGSSQHMITLPCDENTVVLNTPQRFFLDKNKDNPTSFIVTQNDTTSYSYGKKGLVRVTVTEHPNNNATDRIDLGICDYTDKEIIDVDNSENIFVSQSVISYDTKTLKSGGDSQIFIGKFFDNNGNEVTDMSYKWDIICDFKDQLEIAENDNQISIGINNDTYVDEEFKLTLSNDNGDYSSELIIKIESLL